MWFVIGSVSGKAASTSSKNRCPSGSAGRSPRASTASTNAGRWAARERAFAAISRDVAVVDVDFWPVTVEQAGSFSGGEVEIGRFVDRAELLRRKVGQDKLRRVVKLVEHHVARADARGMQSVRQPVRIAVQRGIRPRPAGGRSITAVFSPKRRTLRKSRRSR